MHDCRFIIDSPADGAWNMALDEALLEAAHGQGTYTLRFYRWARPTLSLGYFQAVRQRATHETSAPCPLVRRQTGGGAILHDQEWTYSFAAPAGSPLAVSAMALYRALHGGLIEALAGFGVRARLLEQAESGKLDQEPFLCFQRRSQGDVLLEDAKIAGSAQRRRHGALLQHGSLILRASAAAPEIAGLCDLTGRSFDEEQLRLAWQARAAERLTLRLVEGEIKNEEQALAEQLARDKYSTPAWNEKR
jgi:lipoate-protein ligase A